MKFSKTPENYGDASNVFKFANKPGGMQEEKEGGNSNPNSETLQMLIQTNQLLEKLLFQSQSKT